MTVQQRAEAEPPSCVEAWFKLNISAVGRNGIFILFKHLYHNIPEHDSLDASVSMSG